MKKLKLLEFILSNEDWEERLTSDPFNLTIKRDGDFLMFSYSQIDSDFSLEIVREARGIIFHEPTFTPVCMAFKKFFNVQEIHADNIDWESARVLEKIDGSLIKVWYWDKTWNVSTNGTIDAEDAELVADVTLPDGIRTFNDLFIQAVMNCGLDFNKLNKNYCYLFELTSPYNRIVVPYDEIAIWHIGTRDMQTLEEIEVDIGVYKPKNYWFRSLYECAESSKALGFNEEGFVVVDRHYNRVKVKSGQYVAAHHLRGNGQVTMKRVVEMCLITREQDEFLSYFPQYKQFFEDVLARIEFMKMDVSSAMLHIHKNRDNFADRKKLAEYVLKTSMPHFLFQWFDGKVGNLEEWLSNQQLDKITRMLGYN